MQNLQATNKLQDGGTHCATLLTITSSSLVTRVSRSQTSLPANHPLSQLLLKCFGRDGQRVVVAPDGASALAFLHEGRTGAGASTTAQSQDTQRGGRKNPYYNMDVVQKSIL